MSKTTKGGTMEEKDAVEIEVRDNYHDMTQTLSATFCPPVFADSVVDYILNSIVSRIAERYVEEHYQEIISKIDKKAVNDGSFMKVLDEVKKKLEEKRDVHHYHNETKTKLYQRGVFGGIKRI